MKHQLGETLMKDDYTLAQLIQTRKGERSYARLAIDCAGVVGASRLQQIATAPLSDFPSAETMRGLARALGVSITDVLLASARSLGLPVSSSDPTALVLNGAGQLPQEAQDSLRETAAIMERWMKSGSQPVDSGY